LIGLRSAPFDFADRAPLLEYRWRDRSIQTKSKNMRNRIVSLNAPEPDDYASRHYDASWRSVKAGALLAVLVVAIALLV
jgi:hypothetical protein